MRKSKAPNVAITDQDNNTFKELNEYYEKLQAFGIRLTPETITKG